MTKRDLDSVLTEVAATADVSPGGTLAGSICDRVRADILAGRRKPGARVRLEDLKAEFGVSWSPIREALSRLVAEGLITTEESRGYRIAPVSRTDLAEVIRLRMLLEPMALQRSIEHGDDAWEAEVLAHQHRLGKLESKRFYPAEAEQWERWHRAYHEALIGACGSPILLQFCGQLHDLSDRYRRLFLSAHNFDRDVPGEHRKITEAAVAHDAATACELLRRHIGRTGQNILRSMQV
jgi:GntR family transcriptional regulator, carbon starvation induced regulator